MKHILSIQTDRQELSLPAEDGELLLDVLRRAGIPVTASCGGKGLCGKCRVRITGGEPGEITETESRILKDEEKEQGIRLACLVFPESDLTIELLPLLQFRAGFFLILQSLEVPD